MLSRRLLLGSALAVGLSGCYGKFALTKKLYDWNGSFGNKFLSTVIMWVFMIIPVYGVCTFIDGFVLNLIEFWTGSNPLAMVDHDDGSSTRLTRLSPDQVRLERLVNGEVVHSLVLDRPSELTAMATDAQGQVVAQAEQLSSGALAVTTPAGRLVLSAQEQARMGQASSLVLAVAERLPGQAVASR
jgi:hypothetical protein